MWSFQALHHVRGRKSSHNGPAGLSYPEARRLDGLRGQHMLGRHGGSPQHARLGFRQRGPRRNPLESPLVAAPAHDSLSAAHPHVAQVARGALRAPLEP